MQELNFPQYSFRFKNTQNKTAVFDKLRKKFVILTPEEWVRQNCVRFLTEEKNYPESLINVEKQLKLGDLVKRYDIVVFNPNGDIHLIVECKAPKIKITQETFDQIARYNLSLNASYLMVTNGINHYYCQLDYKAEKYNFLKELPSFKKTES
ncbi:type I restriction enzyme HsdR N-terminal domain-containing protein [Salegentibacter sp. F188]|uniref:Type I restriction enzyme HsdR N-terminal domain-containing protein n=1 Tax=Autumnicola patrickiae TaxID=3075591 RepID=A0ABU3DXQ7_9FLAO|nr:type I restriction enzyme HsdR N-terminal domain-containing protein [Salegentibacter sp. F188]MDT0688504.1 type I restriction enzyme HsdR N-terminal domain-containing protein [Salegentibacter sp. F188]